MPTRDTVPHRELTMYREKRVAVVIPAFNVARHIAGVIRGIPQFVDDIIVVEDAGSDNTAAIVQGIDDARVTLARHGVNQGVGATMVTGFRLALDRGADVVVKMDGDGQMDPEALPALLDPVVVEGYGYAKGNRFLGENRLRDMPRIRLAGSFLLTFLSKLASGYWHLFDTVNGYVAIEAATLRKLPLDRIARRYFFESDMLIQLNVVGARVKDVPLPPRYGDERSSMRISWVLISFPVFLLKGFWYRVYERHVLREFSPVALFWVLGTLLIAWGVAFGAFGWVRSSRTGVPATTGTVMLSVLPLIVGFQLALQAILIEIQESPR
jgi:glycosyltransferase involved in cell wall biosynthesis